jgi:cell division septation protein DedD
MDIRQSIAELLTCHNCVIIPGFGGFIGNYSPARIDPVYHAFHPPAKKLLFNINLRQNDGLLANAVAASMGVSYTDACKLIDDFIEDCRFSLKAGKPFILPDVGQLYSGQEGIIFFEQDPGSNLLPDAFGLTSFISPPIIRNSSGINPDWEIPGQVAQPARKFVFPRAIKWAAAVALPVGIAAIIGVTQYDKITANIANSAGMLNSVLARFSEPSPVTKKTAPVPAKITLVQPVAVPIPEPPVTVNPVAVENNDSYAVIVGAFKIKENAEKLVAELQTRGVDASIFDQSRTGLFRVTIGTSSDMSEAKNMLASVSADFSGAWILSK